MTVKRRAPTLVISMEAFGLQSWNEEWTMHALRMGIRSLTTRFVRDDEAASAVEYGLLVGLIAVVIIVAVTTLGTNLSDMFGDVAEDIAGTTGGSD